MPSLRKSATTLNPKDYEPVQHVPVAQQPLTPVLPTHLTPSTVFITSMPGIATDVDGITRQFYLNTNLPTRRLSLSS